MITTSGGSPSPAPRKSLKRKADKQLTPQLQEIEDNEIEIQRLIDGQRQTASYLGALWRSQNQMNINQFNYSSSGYDNVKAQGSLTLLNRQNDVWFTSKTTESETQLSFNSNFFSEEAIKRRLRTHMIKSDKIMRDCNKILRDCKISKNQDDEVVGGGSTRILAQATPQTAPLFGFGKSNPNPSMGPLKRDVFMFGSNSTPATQFPAALGGSSEPQKTKPSLYVFKAGRTQSSTPQTTEQARRLFVFGDSAPPKSAVSDGHPSISQAAKSSNASSESFTVPKTSFSLKPIGTSARTRRQRTKKKSLRRKPVPTLFVAAPASLSRSASGDVLKERKATKLSPPKTLPPKADHNIIKQRKILKVKRRSATGSSTDKPNSSSRPTSNSPQRDEKPHKPSPPPSPVPKSSASTSSSDTDEVLLIKMRATLLARVDQGWAKKAKGTLHVYQAKSNSKKRWIVLKNNNNECILNLLVEQMLNLNKLVKQSNKGTAAYIKYSVKKRNSTEPLLLQVMPETLDKLYSALLDE